MAENQEKKTPVIVVKNVALFHLLSSIKQRLSFRLYRKWRYHRQLLMRSCQPPSRMRLLRLLPSERKGKEDHHAGPSESTGHGSSPTSAWKRSRQFSRIFALKAAVFASQGRYLPRYYCPGWLSTLEAGLTGMNGTVPYPVSPPGVSICCVPLSPVPPAMTSMVSLPGRFLRMRQKCSALAGHPGPPVGKTGRSGRGNRRGEYDRKMTQLPAGQARHSPTAEPQVVIDWLARSWGWLPAPCCYCLRC